MVEKSITKKDVNGIFSPTSEAPPRRTAGVTLVELLVVIAIIGIMTAVGLVNLDPGASKLKAAALNLRSDLMLAKSEAVKRNLPVRVDAPKSTEAGKEYFANVIVDGSAGTEVFRVQVDDDLLVSGNTLGTALTFTPLGTATNGYFKVYRGSEFYKVSVNAIGRVEIHGKNND